jgi:hypothetical protein
MRVPPDLNGADPKAAETLQKSAVTAGNIIRIDTFSRRLSEFIFIAVVI